ncbi:MAG: hypothetical protein ACREBG_12180 [Pyrinomonadaceae bacterium]
MPSWEQDPIVRFAEIIGWTNIEAVETEEGLTYFGDIQTIHGLQRLEVPDYYENGIALWAAGEYIRGKGIVFEYIQALSELTEANDCANPDDAFKLVFADPRLKVLAAVRAFEQNQKRSFH